MWVSAPNGTLHKDYVDKKPTEFQSHHFAAFYQWGTVWGASNESLRFARIRKEKDEGNDGDYYLGIVAA